MILKDKNIRSSNCRLVILFTLVATSCAAQKQPKEKNYNEDISHLRPKFEIPVDSADTTMNIAQNTIVLPSVEPTQNVNSKVDAVLDSIDRLNVTRKYIDGYTIQIYSGQNREDANNTKKRMSEEVYGLTAELQYIQPKFRVRVGNYFSRIEAQKDLMRLKRHFPNAILIPEKIPIR